MTEVEIVTYDEIPDVAALRRLPGLDAAPYATAEIAVEGVVFDTHGQILLMKRGPGCRDEVGKLEGVGGGVPEDEGFRPALTREIAEELGGDIRIEIDAPLHVRAQRFDDAVGGGRTLWLIASFRCRWIAGQPEIAEPDKNAGFVVARPDALAPADLAASTRFVLRQLQSPQPVAHRFTPLPQEMSE